jgi:hypothetical protein
LPPRLNHCESFEPLWCGGECALRGNRWRAQIGVSLLFNHAKVQRRTSTRVKIRQNEKTAYLGATSWSTQKVKSIQRHKHTFAALVRARSVGYMRLQQRGCRKYLQSHIYIQWQTLCNKALVNLHERKQVPGRRRHAHSRLFGCD